MAVEGLWLAVPDARPGQGTEVAGSADEGLGAVSSMEGEGTMVPPSLGKEQSDRTLDAQLMERQTYLFDLFTSYMLCILGSPINACPVVLLEVTEQLYAATGTDFDPRTLARKDMPLARRLHGVHGCSWACAAKNRCPARQLRGCQMGAQEKRRGFGDFNRPNMF